MKRFTLAIIINTFILFLFACTTLDEKIYTEDGAAIEGYDPVSYFTKQDAIKGDPNISLLSELSRY